MLSFLERIPFLDSILFYLELGNFYMSLFGLKKFLLELFALFVGSAGFVIPSKKGCCKAY